METTITSQRLVKMHYIYPLIVMFAMVLKCSYGQQDTKRYHLSPHQYGLKPANPLDEVPIPDLKEPPPSLDDPRVGELNITALLLKLGTNYDPNVMSIEPPEKDNNVSFFGYRRSQLGRLIPTGTMPEYLNKMDFKSLTLANGSKLKTGISPKLKRKIQQFLWAYSACPVIYRWKDLGVRFWPRYLRSGFCPKNVSCSIPPGMTCKPSVVTHKTLLRWHCSTSTYYNPNKYPPPTNHRRHCKWMKVQYPLLTECSCSCETNSNDDD